MTRALATACLLGVVVWVGAGCGRRAERTAASSDSAAPAAPPAAAVTALTGEEIYDLYCAVCHMADGSGVPNFQPALRGSPIVTGDPAKLEAVVRAGSAALMDREPQFDTEMPPFGNLSEAEVKAIVDYVRERFAPPGNANTAP
jgi:mono/diheme cytochrome c family protein